MSDELEELKKRKLIELQQKLIEEERKKELQKQIEQQKRMILKIILTPEARQRLANVKMVKPEIAETIESQLIQLYSIGKLRNRVSDEQLKRILHSIQKQRKEVKIKYK